MTALDRRMFVNLSGADVAGAAVAPARKSLPVKPGCQGGPATGEHFACRARRRRGMGPANYAFCYGHVRGLLQSGEDALSR
jgi:hypothetical protein